MSMKLYIVPDSERTGRWSFRWEGDSACLGSFPSVESALEASKLFLNCEVIAPTELPAGIGALPSRSVNERLVSLGLVPMRA